MATHGLAQANADILGPAREAFRPSGPSHVTLHCGQATAMTPSSLAPTRDKSRRPEATILRADSRCALPRAFRVRAPRHARSPARRGGEPRALSTGMQAFEISAAKHLNAARVARGQLVGARALRRAGATLREAPQGPRVRGPLSRALITNAAAGAARARVRAQQLAQARRGSRRASRARGRSIRSRRAGCSRAGRNARTSRSRGSCARRTSRCRCGGRDVAAAARAGAATA